jgi:hypothetical protein
MTKKWKGEKVEIERVGGGAVRGGRLKKDSTAKTGVSARKKPA